MKRMLDTTVLISAKYQRSWLVSATFFGNHSIHDFFFIKKNSKFNSKVTLLSYYESGQAVTLNFQTFLAD